MRMTEIADLTATEARRRMAAGTLRAGELLEACLERVAAREGVVRAFAALEPAQVRAAVPMEGPLQGLPLGVKDVIDTVDLPTEYNSPIWRGHRPHADAACVAWARAAGAVVFGKTVTTEFATRTPGPTTNPHGVTRTPGGSSSGSAAAVAAGFVPWAFGTQTAGSVIRPAAYCGVVGYKPSFGLINRHGMKLMSESLDTIGVMARSVADCALLAGAVSGLDLGDPERRMERVPRIGLCRTPVWDRAEPETVALFDRLPGMLARAGARVTELVLPPAYDDFEHVHGVVMNGESARAMGWEWVTHRAELSPYLDERLGWGLAQGASALMAARAEQRRLQDGFAEVMGELDFLLTPAAPGEAPEGLAWTGDAGFNFIWSGLHVPCVTVPCGVGPSGMPLGLQVVGRRGEDGPTLAWSAWMKGKVCQQYGKRR